MLLRSLYGATLLLLLYTFDDEIQYPATVHQSYYHVLQIQHHACHLPITCIQVVKGASVHILKKAATRGAFEKHAYVPRSLELYCRGEFTNPSSH